MAGFTPQGFVNKTLEEIIQSNNERLKSKKGQDVPVTPDSTWGILNGIISLAIKQGGWDLSQQVADQQNVDKAEGKYLDDLAALADIERILPKGSSGNLLFYTTSGTSIAKNFSIKDNQNRLVITKNTYQTTKSSCYSCKVKVESVEDNASYILNLNGVSFDYNSGAGSTEESILAGIFSSVPSTPDYTVTKSEGFVLIKNNVESNSLKVTSSINLNTNEVGSLLVGEAVITGKDLYPANTITNIVSPQDGILSVINPENFELGSEEESDEGLRVRIKTRSTVAGKCTYPAVLSAMLNIEGVTGVLVQNNRTLIEDTVNNLPPKSTKIYVDGSDEQTIAETIFDVTQALSTYVGDISRSVVDSQGNTFTVKFSRTTEKFGWMKIHYVINNEEVFPDNGEDLIKASVVSFGNSLKRGEDYDSTKFYGNIYGACQGFYITSVEIAVTDKSTDTPSYQSSRIPVSKTENLIFNIDQITTILG